MKLIGGGESELSSSIHGELIAPAGKLRHTWRAHQTLKYAESSDELILAGREPELNSGIHGELTKL